MDQPEYSGGPGHLSWSNVALAFSFIALDAVISSSFGLGVGASLITASLRCVVQLAFVGTILQKVFDTENIWAVAAIACLLNVLGTTEAVINKAKRRFTHMFPVVLASMLCATVPVSIIGSTYAMAISPFWKPSQYIPIMGMLCGNSISGVMVSLSHILKELHENRDKVEMYLAFGASRTEACKPIVIEALRLALTPTINQMSVMGIIAIPGMMTGAILGGSSVEQAAKLQMVIMFMISASSALACIAVTILAASIVVDRQHRIRSDRIDNGLHPIWMYRNKIVHKCWSWIMDKVERFRGRQRPRSTSESRALLG